MNEIFEKDHATGGLIARNIGRLSVGSNVARIMLCPDGQVRLFIEASAKTDGSIVFLEDKIQAYGFAGSGELK